MQNFVKINNFLSQTCNELHESPLYEKIAQNQESNLEVVYFLLTESCIKLQDYETALNSANKTIEAIEYLKSVSELGPEQLAKKNAIMVHSYFLMGKIHMRLKEREQAIEKYQLAFTLSEQLLGPDDARTEQYKFKFRKLKQEEEFKQNLQGVGRDFDRFKEEINKEQQFANGGVQPGTDEPQGKTAKSGSLAAPKLNNYRLTPSQGGVTISTQLGSFQSHHHYKTRSMCSSQSSQGTIDQQFTRLLHQTSNIGKNLMATRPGNSSSNTNNDQSASTKQSPLASFFRPKSLRGVDLRKNSPGHSSRASGSTQANATQQFTPALYRLTMEQGGQQPVHPHLQPRRQRPKSAANLPKQSQGGNLAAGGN